MDTIAIVCIVIGALLFIVIVLFVAFCIFKKCCQGRNRAACHPRTGHYYTAAQSQIRRRDGAIKEVKVKRVTKKYPTNAAGDPNTVKVSETNQPPGPGDIFIIPDPPPPPEQPF